MTEALLHCDRARIDAGGAPLIEGLSVTTTGNQVGLVGNFQPLFQLLAGRARVVSGAVRIRGRDPRAAVRECKLGLALADAVLPDAWTALEYLAQSAELAGLRRGEARPAARSALGALGLPHLEARRLATLTLAEKRALLIAHTTLGAPDAIALEAPLEGLDSRGAELVVEAIHRAGASRGVLASVPAPQPLGAERALLDRMDEVLVLEAGLLVAHGSAADALRADTRCALTVTRRGSELVARLTETGYAARLLPGTEGRTHARLIVEISAGQSTDELLDAALAVGAPVVELTPMAAARGDGVDPR